jgi:hypothetical protein
MAQWGRYHPRGDLAPLFLSHDSGKSKALMAALDGINGPFGRCRQRRRPRSAKEVGHEAD